MEISLIGKASAFGTDEYGFESHISNINKLSLNYLHNRLSCRNISKHSFMIMKYTKWTLFLLHKFKYEGVILNFFIWNKKLKVFFMYPGCLTVFRYITFNFKNKSKYTISYKSLIYFLQNNFSTIYFSTSQGIISSEEIFRYKCGGYVLCTIYS